MTKRLLLLPLLSLPLLPLVGCTAKEAIKAPVNFLGYLFGRIPPPSQTTVLQELRQEYEKCVGDGGLEAECTQQAYDTVRLAKGLDNTSLPAGTVTVRRADGTQPASALPSVPAIATPASTEPVDQSGSPSAVNAAAAAPSAPTPTTTDEPTPTPTESPTR